MHSLLTKPVIPSPGESLTRSVHPPSFAELKGQSDGELMVHLQAGCNDALAILAEYASICSRRLASNPVC